MKVLQEGLIAGIDEVGRDFKAGDLFVPEVLIAARAMHAGMDALRPLLAAGDAPGAGKYVIGTVKGDLHDYASRELVPLDREEVLCYTFTVRGKHRIDDPLAPRDRGRENSQRQPAHQPLRKVAPIGDERVGGVWTGELPDAWTKPQTDRRESTMKGNETVIGKLNELLADELTAVNQYMVHAEMCENWGYEKLAGAIQGRAIDEMKHAEKLIARILFLEGLPIVSNLNPIHIGASVEAMHKNDWQAEFGAIKSYNDDIKVAVQVGDNGTRDLLESILGDEEKHIDWLEAQIDQIGQMGIQNYLVEQID